MTSTDEALRRGEARCPGPSVQQYLEHDSRPAPAVLRETAYEHLGSDDIPVQRYTSRAFHDLEVQRLWRRVWQVACREEELAEVGATVVYEIGDDSLIVVRTASGDIRAFHNACLHRGTTLRTDSGVTASLRCPFHGWTWDLEGRLKSIPCEWDFGHVDRDELCLPQAHVATWGGWVFVNMAARPMPFDEFLGSFPEKFPWRQDEFYIQAHVCKELRCNWKVAIEAFIESYHVIATHPQLLTILGDANTQYDVYPDEPRWSRMITAQGVQSPHLRGEPDEQKIMDALLGQFIGDGVTFPVPEGQKARALLAELGRSQLRAALGTAEPSDSEILDAIEYSVFPNFVPWGGYLRLNYRFRPLGHDPDRSLFDVYLLGPFPEGVKRPPPAETTFLGADDDWTAAPEVGGLMHVFNQDMGNLPRVQRGLHATRKRGVTLGNYQEIRIRHYHRELERWLGLAPGAIAPEPTEPTQTDEITDTNETTGSVDHHAFD